jgi:menaquinone-dependent protoporphyrinogen IX oxidase
MKGIVIFDTSYGNTRSIAEAISETLKESGIEIDTFYIKDVKKLSAMDYDFLVMGSPTKFGTMSNTVKGFLNKLKTAEWADKPFAAFDTENPENIEQARIQNKEWSAAEKIADSLREKKMRQLLPVLKGVVFGWKGPLQQGEIERAQEYGRTLALELGAMRLGG